MIVNPTDVREGMVAYDMVGEHVGTITSVSMTRSLEHEGDPAGTGNACKAEGLGFDGDVPAGVVAESGVGDPGTDGCGYLVIEHREILGLVATEMHVPLTAVSDVVPRRSITLGCMKAECESRYGVH